MTPRQFDCLMERYELHLKREDHRAGEVVAMIYNVGRDNEKDPTGISWKDVFPVWQDEPKEQTEGEMFELMQLFASKSNEGLSH